MFSTNIGKKYAKLYFRMFISLEKNYFVGTGCYLFLKKYRHESLSGNKIKLPFPFFISFIFMLFSLSMPCLTVTAR